jgi:hypothetical protein
MAERELAEQSIAGTDAEAVAQAPIAAATPA